MTPAPNPIKPDSLLPALRGYGFTQPTYTQTPNDLFAAIPFLSDSEIRIMLVMVRYTLGYHRTTCQASLTDLERATGLTRITVSKTLQRLRAAGMITRTRRYPTCQWRLNLTEDTAIRLQPGEPTNPAQPPLPSLV